MRAVDWRRRCQEAEEQAESLRDQLVRAAGGEAGRRLLELEAEVAQLRDRLRGAEIAMGKAGRRILGLEKQLDAARRTVETLTYYKEISGG